jgi:uncharacterized pyridoxamine 5'-phosphate oxidase family protein
MHESEQELRELQHIIDRSSARMGPHARSIMDPKKWSISATDICDYLVGIRHLAVATVNSKGQPRVAPVDGWFVHSRFVFGSSGDSIRMRHLERNPSVSATHFVGDDLAVIVHGQAELIDSSHKEAAYLGGVVGELYGSSPFSWGKRVVLARIEPETMLTYSRDFEAARAGNPPLYRR